MNIFGCGTEGYVANSPSDPLDRLASPKLVARFQRYFGIQILTEDESNKRSVKPVLGVHYDIHNWIWYYVFRTGAELGYKYFYAFLFSFWFWNIDASAGRKMVIIWITVMYIGQVMKDLFRWPRPSWPSVIPLEPEYTREYGFPSTHAMAGAAIPLSILLYTKYQV